MTPEIQQSLQMLENTIALALASAKATADEWQRKCAQAQETIDRLEDQLAAVKPPEPQPTDLTLTMSPFAPDGLTLKWGNVPDNSTISLIPTGDRGRKPIVVLLWTKNYHGTITIDNLRTQGWPDATYRWEIEGLIVAPTGERGTPVIARIPDPPSTTEPKPEPKPPVGDNTFTLPPASEALYPTTAEEARRLANVRQSKPLVIKGLKFTGARLNFEQGARDVFIVDCDFSDIPGGLHIGHGIRIIGGATNMVIYGNRFARTGETAIQAWGDMNNVTIQANQFASLFEGIHFLDLGGDGLRIVNNTFRKIRRMGVELQGDKRPTGMIVAHNDIVYDDIATTYDGTFGLSIMPSCVGSQIIGNHVKGPSGNQKPGTWGVAVGIELKVINSVVSGNYIEGTNNAVQIADASGSTIGPNTINDAGQQAFWLTGTGTCVNLRVAENQISSKGVAFLFTGSPSTRSGVVIEENEINAPRLYQGEFGGKTKQ